MQYEHQAVTNPANKHRYELAELVCYVISLILRKDLENFLILVRRRIIWMRFGLRS